MTPPIEKLWADEEIILLAKMLNGRESYDKISRKLGRTKSACYTMAYCIRYRVDKISNKMFSEHLEKYGVSEI